MVRRTFLRSTSLRRMVCSCTAQVAAVEDLDAIAGQEFGPGPAELVDDRCELLGGVPDQRAADLGLDPPEFGVDGTERDLDLVPRGSVGGIDLGTDVADDQGHQV